MEDALGTYLDPLCEATAQQQRKINALRESLDFLSAYYASTDAAFVRIVPAEDRDKSSLDSLRLGTLQGFDMEQNKFTFAVSQLVEDQLTSAGQCQCTAADLCFVTSKELSPSVLEKLKQALPARPEPARVNMITQGMELKGSIFIPGLTETSDKADVYTVVVKGRHTDAFGNEIIEAVHAAYSDEQVVYLRVDGTNICYADRETYCKGNLELSENMIRLQGSVSQLKEDESGFFYPAKAKTNCFDICGSRVVDILRLQAEIGRLKEERNETLVKIADLVNVRRDTNDLLRRHLMSGNGQTRYHSTFQHLNWREVKLVSALKVEKIVNRLRGIVQKLNEKQFDTFEARKDYLSDLKQRGISRAQIHRETDKSLAELKKLIHLQLKLNVANALDQDMQDKYRRCFVRINDTYERFDTALQKAESRLPLLLIEDWLHNSDGDLLELTCTICLFDIDPKATPEYLRTPCGHNFHPECIKSWLHVNSTCPSCRAQLNK